MGNFYTNITVQGLAQDDLIEFLSRHGRVAYVVPSERKQAVVFDEAADESFSLEISKEFRCLTFWVNNHDDDVLQYVLCRSGKILDRYNSRPGYFSGDFDQTPPTGGAAQALCKACSVPESAQRVEDILQASYHFESQRHQDLITILGLPQIAVGVGYDDVDSDEEFAEAVDVSRVQRSPETNREQEKAIFPKLDADDIDRVRDFLDRSDGLREFTLRGMVALAVRCGRRAQLKDASDSDMVIRKKDAARIEAALSVAEAFCVSPENTEDLRNKLAMAAFNIEKDVVEVCPSIYNPAEWTNEPMGKLAAFLVARAADAADSADFYREYWNYDIALSEALTAAEIAIVSGIPTIRDIERLREIDSEDCTVLGQPIDPSERGPLGVFW